MVEEALYHHCIGGTVPVPLIVMEMQTGSTNNHISQIFFVFAAPMYCWHWLIAPVQMVVYKVHCHVSSTRLNRLVDV
jgi:hypothetical protein